MLRVVDLGDLEVGVIILLWSALEINIHFRMVDLITFDLDKLKFVSGVCFLENYLDGISFGNPMGIDTPRVNQAIRPCS